MSEVSYEDRNYASKFIDMSKESWNVNSPH